MRLCRVDVGNVADSFGYALGPIAYLTDAGSGTMAGVIIRGVSWPMAYPPNIRSIPAELHLHFGHVRSMITANKSSGL